MEIVCLRPEGQAGVDLPERNADVRILRDLESLSSDQLDAQAIMVDSADDDEASRVVDQVRSHPEHYLTPLFASRSLAESNPLVDGPAEVAGVVDSICADISDAIKSLGSGRTDLGPENRLLRYLYTRPELTLDPVPDWTLPQLYTYPVNASLIQDPSPSGPVLMSLLARGFLEPVRLIDRIRMCPQCVQAQLLFIDLCPNCQHIEIAQTQFLHCFTCGHVGKEESFALEDTMRCPRCRTALRLIGTDYDRPLENHACGNCQHQFIDPDVQARCMGCTRYWSPGDLVKMNVHSIAITPSGRMAARTGSWGDVYKVMDHLNFSDINHFIQTLDWQLRLVRRHSEVGFGLICLRMDNVLELVDQLGRNKVSQMLDTFAERVRQLVRTTDLISRSNEQLIWLLLPQTPRSGCDTLLARLLELQEATTQPDGKKLIVQGVSVVAPADLDAHDSAKSLMARVSASVPN